MKKKLTRNWGLKIISTLFAIVLWLIVVNIIDPVEKQSFSGIHVTVENDYVIKDQGKVFDIMEDSDVISVTVKGRRSALDKMKSTDFIATADMEDMIVIDTVPIDVSATKYNDKIQEIVPKTKTLKISVEDSDTKQFAIATNITGTPGEGYAVGDITCNPSVLKVTGAASAVRKISKVAVSVDVSDMTTIINTTATPKFYDSDGDVVESTSLEYKNDDVAVSVDLLKTKEVDLKFAVKGTPADDYQCVGTVCSPEKITIAGEEEDLAKVSTLSVMDNPIDVSDATDNVQQVIDISSYLPRNIRLVDSSEASVLVTAIIEQLETKTIEIDKNNIQTSNLSSNYTFDFANTDNILVTVKGLAENISDMSADDIKASIDLSEIKETGTKTLPVAITLADGTDAEVVGTVTVNVVIKKNSSSSNKKS